MVSTPLFSIQQDWKKNLDSNEILNANDHKKLIMYGIAITYGVVSLLLLGGFAYITFKMTSKK